MSDPAAAAAGSAEEVDTGEEQANLSKEQAAESKQLDTVTDFAEEAEMDASKAQAALSHLTSAAESDEQVRVARELAAVQVKQEDIDMLSKELEISQDEAENKIRQAKGDITAAIAAAMQ